MLRRMLAVIAALFVWVVVASIANRVLRASWQGYAEVEVAMAFTGSMLVLRLLIGALASICAGLVVLLFTRSDSLPASVAAGMLFVFFLPVHYLLWSRFPAWYHLLFLASLVALPPLGFAVGKRSA